MLFSYQSVLLAVLAFLIFIFFLVKLQHGFSPSASNHHRNLPPSPPKLPLIGNLHKLGLFPHRNLQSLAQKYGPIMLLHLGSQPVLVISTADGAREIMKTHDLVFSTRPRTSIPPRLLYDFKDVAFAPYGQYWRQVKSLCVLHLLTNRKVQSFRNVREEEVSFLIDHIRESSFSSSLVNLSDAFMSLTNDVVCRVGLGRKYGGGDSQSGMKFEKLLAEFIELLGVFDVGDYIPWLSFVNRFRGLDAKIKRVAMEFDEFLEDVITEHMQKKKKKRETDEDGRQDFVDILLEIQDGEETGLNFETDTIKALILDMFAAGTHTTSTVLEWAMTELLRHPRVMDKLQKELRDAAKGKSMIEEEDLERLDYLKAVIKETFRLHPPIPLLVPRESTQDVKVKGYDIKERTQVFINAWAIGRDPLTWREPEEFYPERFLNSSVDFKGLHFELIPFGAGRRLCPGQSFAMAIDELALANVVCNFDFELRNEGRREDVNGDIGETPGLTVRPKYPLLVLAKPYNL